MTDIIGGFTYADLNCKGCGKPLELKNACLTDGCPCNTALGVNSMNETRWRLLMQLQREQAMELEKLRRILAFVPAAIAIKAKEESGYGTIVRTFEKRGV